MIVVVVFKKYGQASFFYGTEILFGLGGTGLHSTLSGIFFVPQRPFHFVFYFNPGILNVSSQRVVAMR